MPEKKTSSKKLLAEEEKTKKAVSKKTTTKKKTTKKATTSKSTKAKASSKATKTTSKSKTTAKTVSTAKTKNKQRKTIASPLEYYDLPYGYNKTVVKILAQTPNTLFVYWDISEEDKQKYIEEFGNNFFDNTKPVLIVHNLTKNYSFEIEINDFANSWYFNTNDTNCEYKIELGRRFKYNPDNYMQITTSNQIEAPNDHILFEQEQKAVFFKNVKTNEMTSKNLANLQFIKHIGRIYNIYDLYTKIYKNGDLEKIQNPSSK